MELDHLGTMRHTASHILAQAVKRLWPEAKLAIGPATKDGFYYDFDLDVKFTPDDFVKIEKEMRRIVKANYPLVRSTKTRQDAIKYMEANDEPYKVELIRDLPEDVEISFYTQGDFTDLCAGPHLASTGEVKAFKILSVAGAYWRGSEKNKMLQRLYATAYDTQEELDAELNRIEEAKKRDHRKIGQQLELFTILDEGPGFPFFLPNGMILRNELENYWRDLHRANGYSEIRTPMILNEQLWHQSGHWDHYKDNMYTTVIDEKAYALKPMNCPGSILVYKTKPHSYKELPIRLAELGVVHRHENSGNLHGLMRVRCFTQDDAHIFMTPEQITQEVTNVIKMINEVYNIFGFKYHVELSTRPEDSMGTDEQWNKATEGLRNALELNHMDYVVNEGDGAFYGPKIDFHLEDCIGRTWQCGTIQLDFQMPERFDLEYTGSDGLKHRPVMIHRVLLGSVERFIGILTEHQAGAYSTWLAPVQVRVLPISENHSAYAADVATLLRQQGVRVKQDDSNEKFGKKLREAIPMKSPYVLIVGDSEVAQNSVTVRYRTDGHQETMPTQQFVDMITQEIASKKI